MLHALGYLYLLCVLQSEVRLADRRGTLRPPAPAFHTDSHYSLGTQWMEADGVHFYANRVKGWENTPAHVCGFTVGGRRNTINAISEPFS